MSSLVRISLGFFAVIALLSQSSALAGEAPAAPPGEKKAEGVKIGFANIKTVIDNYKRTKTLEGDIQEYQQKEGDKIEASRKMLKDKRDQLKMLQRGTRMFNETWKEARRLEMDINYQEESLKEDLQLRLLKATRDVYEDIVREIQEFAKAKGYTAILKVEAGELESESKAELILRINSRGVLYFDPALDVSEEIVKSLNAKYTGSRETDPAKKEGEGAKKEGEGAKEEGKAPEKEPEKKAETPPGSKAGN